MTLNVLSWSRRLRSLNALRLVPTMTIESPQDENAKQLALLTLLPSDWGIHTGAGAVWVSAFRLFLAPVSAFDSGPLAMDCLGGRLVAIIGNFRFPTGGDLLVRNWRGEGDIEYEVTQASPGLFEGALLLVFLPIPLDYADQEAAVRRGLSSIVAVARVVLGHNVAYDQAFEFILEPESKFSVLGKAIRHPGSFPVPPLGREALASVEEMSLAIDALPVVEERNLIVLALEWFNDASDRWGSDALLRYWIAIEVLAMPDTTNIGPIHRALADAYGLDIAEAQAEFLVGRVMGLRSAIVHSGYQPAVSADLEDYVRALFVDLVHHRLSLPSPHAARQALKETKVRDELMRLTARTLVRR